MPYIASGNFTDEAEVIGNGQCVTLVKKLTGAPPSSLWREGEKVMDLLSRGKPIARGTAIATFINGHYPNLTSGNHAAVFIRSVAGGIEIFDQWKKQKPAKRILSFGRPAAAGVNRPELYSIVK